MTPQTFRLPKEFSTFAHDLAATTLQALFNPGALF
jgi:hypothetical protein